MVVDEGPGGGLAGRTVVDDHTCGHGGWLSATVTHTRGDGCGLVVARVLTPESTGVVVVVGQCGEHVATWMAWVPPRVAQGLMATPHHNHACATPWSLCKPSTPLAWWWCAPCPALALVCVSEQAVSDHDHACVVSVMVWWLLV